MKKKEKEKTENFPLLERWDGTEESKARFHKDGQKVLREVARRLGLKKNDFDVYSNEAGPAIAGDVYLHTDTFHLWVNGGGGRQWSLPNDPHADGYAVARRVKHRKDYTGETNVDIPWELLWNPDALISVLRLEGVLPGE